MLWLLGLVLLVGTAAGASWLLNHGSSAAGASPTSAEPNQDLPEGVICTAYVDVEQGVGKLYPLQPGRVVWVAEEGAVVARDQPLLKLDDSLVRADLKRAEADLAGAREQLKKAKLLPEQREQQIKQIRALIQGLQSDRDGAAEQLAEAQDLFKNKMFNAHKLQAAKDAVKKVESLIEGAKAKLREAELVAPDLDIARATNAITEKEAVVEKARQAIREYQVLAPYDGTVLRVLVGVGDALGPNIRGNAAVEFCANTPLILRAEVMQEWASLVREKQAVVIEDDTSGPRQKWEGRVKRLGGWFTNRRSILQEPLQLNDNRTLEALIEVTGTVNPPFRIGQRMRVIIRNQGPAR
jgi:multidrug resistance efflux pump